MNEITKNQTFRFIERSPEGAWRFKGRRLDVFGFYFMFTSQNRFTAEEWADTYHLSMAHLDEAKRLCELVEPYQYARRVEDFEEEDRRLIEGPPF